MFVLSRVNVVWLKRACVGGSCDHHRTAGPGAARSARSAKGNQNWIDVGPFTLQPSEPPSSPSRSGWPRCSTAAKLLHGWRARPDSGRAPGPRSSGWYSPETTRHGHDRHDHRGAALFFAGVGSTSSASPLLPWPSAAVLAITSPNRVLPHPVLVNRANLRRGLRRELPVPPTASTGWPPADGSAWGWARAG